MQLFVHLMVTKVCRETEETLSSKVKQFPAAAVVAFFLEGDGLMAAPLCVPSKSVIDHFHWSNILFWPKVAWQNREPFKYKMEKGLPHWY